MKKNLGSFVPPSPAVDGNLYPLLPRDHAEEYAFQQKITEAFYTPDIDKAVALILRETQELRAQGMLRPFVEGEPIGMLPLHPVKRAQPKDDSKEYRRKQRQWQREELRLLRAQNDTTAREILSDNYRRTA